jgi:hypothetical protein
MINPYYLVFYKTYNWLLRLNVQQDGVLFSSYSVLFIIFIPHLLISMIILKAHNIINFDLNVNKYLFGLTFALLFWLINYLLFGYKNRYRSIIIRIENKKRAAFAIAYGLLTVYFSIPIIAMLF